MKFSSLSACWMGEFWISPGVLLSTTPTNQVFSFQEPYDPNAVQIAGILDIVWGLRVLITALRLFLLCPIQQIECIVARRANCRLGSATPVFPFPVKLVHFRENRGVQLVLVVVRLNLWLCAARVLDLTQHHLYLLGKAYTRGLHVRFVLCGHCGHLLRDSMTDLLHQFSSDLHGAGSKRNHGGARLCSATMWIENVHTLFLDPNVEVDVTTRSRSDGTAKVKLHTETVHRHWTRTADRSRRTSGATTQQKSWQGQTVHSPMSSCMPTSSRYPCGHCQGSWAPPRMQQSHDPRHLDYWDSFPTTSTFKILSPGVPPGDCVSLKRCSVQFLLAQGNVA